VGYGSDTWVTEQPRDMGNNLRQKETEKPKDIGNSKGREEGKSLGAGCTGVVAPNAVENDRIDAKRKRMMKVGS